MDLEAGEVVGHVQHGPEAVVDGREGGVHHHADGGEGVHDALDGLEGPPAALLGLLHKPAGGDALGAEAVIAQPAVAVAVGAVASIEGGAIGAIARGEGAAVGRPEGAQAAARRLLGRPRQNGRRDSRHRGLPRPGQQVVAQVSRPKEIQRIKISTQSLSFPFHRALG